MIHKTAIVDSKAKIPSSANIGPYCVVGPNVEIGENATILPCSGKRKIMQPDLGLPL